MSLGLRFEKSGGLRVSKFEHAVWELLQGSSMKIEVKKALEDGEPTHIVITVAGPAARVPSTTNSRLNMFPKVGILKLLGEIENGQGQPRILARKAAETLKRTHVAATINPEHKVRLEALKRLYEALAQKPLKPIKCNKDNRWLVTLHLHEDLHRVDSHNLTKPVCDWLQDVGLIENDKHVDCFPTRNVDLNEVVQEKGKFYVALRRTEDVSAEVEALARKMLY